MGNTTSCSILENQDEYTVSSLRKKCKALIQECEEMSSTLKSSTDRLRKQHAEQIAKLETSNEQLLEENQILSLQNDRLQLKQRSDTVAIQLFKSEAGIRNEKISSLQKELASLKEENDMIRDELGDCVENIESMRDENYTLEQEQEEAKEAFETYKETSIPVNDYEAVKKEFAEYQTTSNILITSLHTEVSDLKAANDQLQSSIDSQNEVNQYNTALILRLENEDTQLKIDNEKLKNQLETRKIEKKEIVEEFNHTVDQLHIIQEDVEGLQKELRVEREKGLALKKLNFSLKHELKSALKTMKKEKKKAIQDYIVSKLKMMCESSFQDDCLNELMDETWIPNNFERWFYEDIYTHIMMHVQNILIDDRSH